MVKEGKADLLGYYLDSKEAAADAGLALSTPYISLNNIIVRNKSVIYPSRPYCRGYKGKNRSSGHEPGGYTLL